MQTFDDDTTSSVEIDQQEEESIDDQNKDTGWYELQDKKEN